MILYTLKNVVIQRDCEKVRTLYVFFFIFIASNRVLNSVYSPRKTFSKQSFHYFFSFMSAINNITNRFITYF